MQKWGKKSRFWQSKNWEEAALFWMVQKTEAFYLPPWDFYLLPVFLPVASSFTW